jgi:putative hemolysin
MAVGARNVPRSPLNVRVLDLNEDTATLWNQVDVVTFPGQPDGAYVAGLACSDRCVREAQRLRYEVFNVELGEGLTESAVTGLDQDAFDRQMSHLVLLERATGAVIGTYRVQTASHALKHNGLYSAGEYQLDGLAPYLDQTIELGRACIAGDHRRFAAVLALWLGIGGFMNMHGQRYLFGCCSLTSTDPDDGWRAMKTIRANGHIHRTIMLPAKEPCSCGPASREFDADLGDALRLPKLFRAYVRLGAQVISEPAIDREFGTVDFLVFLDGYGVTLARLDVLQRPV